MAKRKHEALRFIEFCKLEVFSDEFFNDFVDLNSFSKIEEQTAARELSQRFLSQEIRNSMFANEKVLANLSTSKMESISDALVKVLILLRTRPDLWEWAVALWSVVAPKHIKSDSRNLRFVNFTYL